MYSWMGECHVNAGIQPGDLQAWMRDGSDADLPAERTKVLCIGGMIAEAERSECRRFLVATETGILPQLRKTRPETEFELLDRKAMHKSMKVIAADNLVTSFREGVFDIGV